MPRNDASFAIFTFALQIRRRGKHAVAFVSYTCDARCDTINESSRIAEYMRIHVHTLPLWNVRIH